MEPYPLPSLPDIERFPDYVKVCLSNQLVQFKTITEQLMYFQVIDTAMGTIKDRFDQRGFLMLQKLETLLISRSAMDRSTLSDRDH